MSYLVLAKTIEARQTLYREALQRYWSAAEAGRVGQSDGADAYQTLLRLLDDLGVARARAIRDHEVERATYGR